MALEEETVADGKAGPGQQRAHGQNHADDRAGGAQREAGAEGIERDEGDGGCAQGERRREAHEGHGTLLQAPDKGDGDRHEADDQRGDGHAGEEDRIGQQQVIERVADDREAEGNGEVFRGEQRQDLAEAEEHEPEREEPIDEIAPGDEHQRAEGGDRFRGDEDEAPERAGDDGENDAEGQVFRDGHGGGGRLGRGGSGSMRQW